MSPREQVQDKIVNFLEKNHDKFNAPYGILPALQNIGNSKKVRTITFGVAAYLDATIFIWTPKRITIMCRGPLEHKIVGQYVDADHLIEHFTKEFDIKENEGKLENV